MAKLQPNTRIILSAINGAGGLYQIDKNPGLHLHVLPSGKASWRLRYRPSKGAQQRWFTLGDARSIELGTAVAKARKLMSGVQVDGTDPHDTSLQAPTADTFETLFNDWLEKHSKVHKKTWRDDVDIHQKHIASTLNHRPVSEITRREISDLFDKIAKTAPGRVKNAKILLSSLWNWAIDSGRADINPAARQRSRQDSKPRERVLTDDEVARVWHALETRARGHQMARAIKLLILTGARVNEVIGAGKLEIAGDVWTKPAIRMKNDDPHTVPLTATAKALFAECAAASSNGQIFSGRAGSGREMFNPGACSRAVTRIMKELQIDASAHDFRRTIATRLSEMGTPDDIIERLLSHRGGRKTVTGMHYNHNDKLPEKRKALELWEQRILAIVSGTAIPIGQK
jgi:integrase